MAQTNREFLLEKRKNFVKFCKESLSKHKNDERFKKFNDKLGQLEALNIELFITAIVEQMLPHKADPSQYVLKVLGENSVSKADLTPDELNKCVKYIECFIAVVLTS